MRTIPLSLLLFSALFIGGCSVTKDYVKPQITTPKAFKGWKIATPKDTNIADKWWQEYKDPELDTYMQAVDVSNQTLAKDAAAYKYALAVVDASKADFMPTVGAGISATTSQTIQTLQNSSATKTTKSVDASLQASWMPDIWGEVKRAVEANEANAQATKADLAAARLSTQILLAQSYFELQSLDSQAILLDEISQDYKTSLVIIQNQYNAGIVAQTDLLSAQQSVKAVSAQMSEIKIQRAQLEHSIAVLIGKNPSEFSIAQKALHVEVLQLPSLLPSQMLERRPDIASAERKNESCKCTDRRCRCGMVSSTWTLRIHRRTS